MAPDLATRLFGADGDVAREPAAQSVFVAHAILVMGTVLLSPLVADLANVFAVSEARAGLFIVAYTGTLLVVLPVAGVVADRIGRKAAVVPAVALFGVAGAAIALVNSFEAALLLRSVQAASVAFAKPVLVAFLGDIYAGARETTAQGIRVATDSAFSVVTPVLAGTLFVVSWRAPFLVYLIAVPAAGALWLLLPDEQSGASRSVTAYVRELGSFVSGRTVGLLMPSFFFRHVMLYGMYTYISVLAIREVGMAVVMVGVLIGVRSAMKALFSTQAGRAAAAFDTAPVATVGIGLLGVSLVSMGLYPTATVLFVGMAVFGLADGLLSPTQKSLVNQLSPPENRGSAMSTALVFQNLGKTAGPLFLGALLGIVGPAAGFVAIGVIGGVAGTLLLAGVWLRTARPGRDGRPN